jgi:signal transduction histidine kinase
MAVALSIVSFQFSSYASNEILKIASEDVRSNAQIQAHDLERIMANSMSSTSSNLHIIANAPAVQGSNFDAGHIIFDTAQNSTSNLTNFYMWLDKDGRLVWLSNINQTSYEQFKGTDLSQRAYFIQPKNTLDVYYSNAIDSNDDIPRVYVSYPIIDSQTREFKGVAVAGIRLATLGTFLQQELSPDFRSTFGMVDRNGTVLYSATQSLIAKNIFGEDVQSVLPAEVKGPFNRFIKDSLKGNSGIEDFTYKGNTSSIAYEPIVIDGNQFGTLYIVTPHQFAGNVGVLVDQQRNLSTILVMVIGGIAIGVAVLVVTWNQRLERTVYSRTAELSAKSEELKRSHDSLAAANEQLKVHDKLQKEFINVAAHELRTPTQAILGYAELLQMDPDDRDEMIKAIYRNSIRLQRLTSDILDVTRIESESLKLEKEEFNLKEVIQGAMQDSRNQMANGKVKFVYEPKDVYVKADRGRITQVVSNLLDNAAKFTKEGAIMVSTEARDGQAIVNIKDTGAGIDSEIMPRLFSKFATKSEKGTGLGLFIARSILEAHYGRIWCANNSDGKGATFAFSLPLSKS